MAIMRWGACDLDLQVTLAVPGKYEKLNLVDMMSPAEDYLTHTDFTLIQVGDQSKLRNEIGHCQDSQNNIFIPGTAESEVRGSPVEAPVTPFPIFVAGLVESEAQESPVETHCGNCNSVLVLGPQQAGSQGSPVEAGSQRGPTEAESSPSVNIFTLKSLGFDAHRSPAEAVCSLCKNICNLEFIQTKTQRSPVETCCLCNLMISFRQYSLYEFLLLCVKLP